MTNKQSIRQAMRQKRNSLSAPEQARQARKILQQLATHPEIRFCRRIALYIANDGEISPEFVAQHFWKRGQRVYLPVLHPVGSNRLCFARYSPTTQLKKNRYGIPEPNTPFSRRTEAWTLDCVLLPLVAFDRTGGRLGMGGGYYDRTFAFLNKTNSAIGRIRMVGMAHSFQERPLLPVERWDIPLTHIATEQAVFKINCKVPLSNR